MKKPKVCRKIDESKYLAVTKDSMARALGSAAGGYEKQQSPRTVGGRVAE